MRIWCSIQWNSMPNPISLQLPIYSPSCHLPNFMSSFFSRSNFFFLNVQIVKWSLSLVSDLESTTQVRSFSPTLWSPLYSGGKTQLKLVQFIFLNQTVMVWVGLEKQETCPNLHGQPDLVWAADDLACL